MRTRQTSITGNQNEARNSDSSDTDSESEDEPHYVMGHGTEILIPDAESFDPQLGNTENVNWEQLRLM